jgi:uncharacterized protein YdbL (DUF1318 family)
VTLVLRVAVAAMLTALAAAAPAQNSPTIIAARQAGMVGERYDGYLGYSPAAGEGVRREVGAVNIKRRSLYTNLAVRRRATVQEVGVAAGCELLGSVKVGEAYVLSDGAWRRRGAGEAAPVPSYCGH